MVLEDSLIFILSPHYSNLAIMPLYLPEAYRTLLPPVPSHTAAPPTKLLFLRDPDSLKPPLPTTILSSSVSVPPSGTTFDMVNPAHLCATSSAGPPSHSQPPSKTLVKLSPDPPLPSSLAAELAADAALASSDKESEAQHLEDFIKTNTNPTGRGRHLSAKEKRAASSSTGEKLHSFPVHLYLIPFHSC